MTQLVEQLLTEVGFKIGTLREARNRFADQLAPEFRIFDYLRTDEIGLSRCIASLLNPKGKHGQGGIFLDTFLQKILDTDSSWEINAQNFSKIALEKQANGQRRIDIYLEFTNGIIGIENKPWASDQDDQLSDYAKFLKEIAGNKSWLLIFLSKRDPNMTSLTPTRREELKKAGNFIHCDFEVVIEWLDLCAYKSKAPVVRVFIEELVKFIRTDINGEVDMSDAIEIKSVVLKSPGNLESAFQIAKVMDDVKKELIAKLRDDLDSGLKKNGFRFANWNIGSGKKPIGFDINFGEKEQSLSLRFDFETLSLDRFAWGIYNKRGEHKNQDAWGEINRILNAELYSGKTSHPWWPWYLDSPNHDFDAEMKNWSISSKPWLMIRDEKLASKIIELAGRVHNAFKKESSQLDFLYEDPSHSSPQSS